MTSTSLNNLVILTSSTKLIFLQYLRDNSNNRRVSQIDKEILIDWLTNSHKRSSFQKKFSWRNYVWKIFAWDEKARNLIAVAKTNEVKNRMMITDDMISNVVKIVHKDNNHVKWDVIWKKVSTFYYDILRSNVIFLLKQCQICVSNLFKRSKSFAITMLSFQSINHEVLDFLNVDDMQCDMFAWNVPNNEKHSSEWFRKIWQNVLIEQRIMYLNVDEIVNERSNAELSSCTTWEIFSYIVRLWKKSQVDICSEIGCGIDHSMSKHERSTVISRHQPVLPFFRRNLLWENWHSESEICSLSSMIRWPDSSSHCRSWTFWLRACRKTKHLQWEQCFYIYLLSFLYLFHAQCSRVF